MRENRQYKCEVLQLNIGQLDRSLELLLGRGREGLSGPVEGEKERYEQLLETAENT